MLAAGYLLLPSLYPVVLDIFFRVITPLFRISQRESVSLIKQEKSPTLLHKLFRIPLLFAGKSSRKIELKRQIPKQGSTTQTDRINLPQKELVTIYAKVSMGFTGLFQLSLLANPGRSTGRQPARRTRTAHRLYRYSESGPHAGSQTVARVYTLLTGRNRQVRRLDLYLSLCRC